MLIDDIDFADLYLQQLKLAHLKRAKLFKIDMDFFQDKPEARI
ncbi:hypothetical protein OM315_09075 [Escherichia albertii]|nr:hypothetical protein [Escherichia albertii]